MCVFSISVFFLINKIINKALLGDKQWPHFPLACWEKAPNNDKPLAQQQPDSLFEAVGQLQTWTIKTKFENRSLTGVSTAHALGNGLKPQHRKLFKNNVTWWINNASVVIIELTFLFYFQELRGGIQGMPLCFSLLDKVSLITRVLCHFAASCQKTNCMVRQRNGLCMWETAH